MSATRLSSASTAAPANRPFPQWQGIQTAASRARSNYNSLQAKWEHRYSAGFYSLFSYTWASALDEGGAWDAGNSPQILDNFASERGFMAQTARHRMSYAGIYELPFGRNRKFGSSIPKALDFVLGGWQLSGIWSWRTGLPVNVGLVANGVDPQTGARYLFLGRNGGALRSNRAGDANTGIDPKTDRLRFLDVNAYRVQPVNTPGNAARNSAWGPGFFQLDSSLVKQFRFAESHQIDVRWEAFNLLNTVNFANPAATVGNTNFGVINNAGDPRVMQMAIRYRF